MAVRVTARIAAFIPDASSGSQDSNILVIHNSFYTIIRQNQKVTALIFSTMKDTAFIVPSDTPVS